MKTALKIQPLLILFFITTAHLFSQGYIVPNGVTSTFFGSAFELHVIQNPTNGNYTGFLLEPQNASTFRYDPFADEGVRTFFVSLNQPISQQAIQSGSYTELMFPNNYVFSSGLPFYLGLYTGETFPQNGVYTDPLFGWVRLRNNQGAIELLDSALVYKAGGIYAGTLNFVPEPSGLALAALGASLLSAARFRTWRS